jgi:hypothetical protein
MSDYLNSSSNDDFDFDKAASAFPDISLDGEGDFPGASAPPQTTTTTNAGANTSSGFSFDDFGSPPRGAGMNLNAVKVTGDEEIEKFESEFPELDVGPPSQVYSPPSQATFGATPTFAPRPQPSFSTTPMLNSMTEEDEPQVIKDWREKQAAEIAARDETSKKKRQDTIAKAERSIDEFYEEYSAKKERNIRENKDHESEFLSNLTNSLSAGTTWERICDLIELQNSQSKTLARTGAGTTELGRFKEVLLRLKREGSSAPGAAGY